MWANFLTASTLESPTDYKMKREIKASSLKYLVGMSGWMNELLNDAGWGMKDELWRPRGKNFSSTWCKKNKHTFAYLNLLVNAPFTFAYLNMLVNAPSIEWKASNEKKFHSWIHVYIYIIFICLFKNKILEILRKRFFSNTKLKSFFFHESF